ncbi:MAG: serine/threonine protein kinase, partial [Planctomycetes bacterium]|nr:serine/threonine protein kinase [Planctomycetota bacterium]
MSERALPSEVGGYTVVGQLGMGSYGAVFRVRRKGLLRDLALKVLPADLNPEDLQRFRREARVVARLDHPFVVRGFEFGRDAATGWHYLCLDLVEGPSLKQHLQRVGPLPWARALELVVDVACAVDYAHQQGVIHRDLKPANVLLDRHGFVRVTDFGLARDLGELSLTAPGEVLGTPYYMAPEQVRGEKGTPQFDVHALGVMLFELVTGERPYPGESIAEVVGLILEGQPPRPSERATQALPPGFDAVCQRAMASDPAQRFASARALADALQELERGHGGALQPPQRRRTPESVGLPAAAPSRAPAGALLGAGVAAAMLLPLLSLALVWGWARGGSRRLAAPAPALEAAPAP